MAYIGIRRAIFAPITTETEGSAIVYGTGTVLGKMRDCNVTLDRNDEKFFADDAIAESDNSVTGGNVKFTLDDIDEADQVAALGLVRAGESNAYTYSESDDAAPVGGFGYIRVRQKAGVTSYIGFWIYKVQLSIKSEDAKTKEDKLTYTSPTLEGTIHGVKIDNSGKTFFRIRQIFATQALAEAWLNGLANIT